MKKNRLSVFCLFILLFFVCGCSGLLGTRIGDSNDAHRWLLTSMNGIPAKFNIVSGDMWILGSDGWVRIDDDYTRRVGSKHMIMRMNPAFPLEGEKR